MSEYGFNNKARDKVMDIWSSKSLCLCVIDKHAEARLITPGTLRLLGMDGDDITAPALADFIHPEDREEFHSFISRAANAENEISAGSFRILRQQGTIISVLVQAEKFGNSGANILLHIHENNNSPTEQANEAFGEMDSFQATAESMIESILDGVFIVDVNGRIIMTNEALLEMLQIRRYEIIGIPVGALFTKDPQDIEKATVRFGKIMRFGRVREMNTTLEGKNNANIPVIFTGSVIRSAGNELLGILAVVKDMREDKLLKELEKKNEELEKVCTELKVLDDMKDDLLSLVGHELRAPLSNILGYSEFLKEEELSREEIEEFSGIIYQESHRLSRLVNDILDLSRMDRGKLAYNYIKESLNEVIKRSVLAVEKSLSAKNIRVDISLDEKIPVLELDPDRIQQVTVNILDNAIKCSDPGKTIKIKTESRPGEALVNIEDHGVGIAKENAHKVFAKFGQIEDIRKHSTGSGLGMPIAKRIIEEGHGGKIWFESPGLGKGTTFYFSLPEGDRE